MNLLLEAREIVRTHFPSPAVHHLRTVADDFDDAYKTMQKVMTRETVTRFVAQSTRLLLAIENVYTSNPTPPLPCADRRPRTQAA